MAADSTIQHVLSGEHIEGREFVPRESLRVKEPPRQGVLF